ncbi:MAG: transglutaminase-like domain-containing protein [Planctomycetaceae bacterium]
MMMGFGRWVAIWKRRSAPGWCRLVVWTSVLASVWSGDVCWAQAAREKIEATDEWQSLYLGKTRVGYLRSASAPETVDGRELIRSRSETALTIARFGQKVKLRIVMESLETPAGEWLSFVSTMENPPSLSTRTEGRVEGDDLVLTSTVGGKTTTRRQPWDRQLKSPAWQDRLLRDKKLEPGAEMTLQSFEPQFARAMTVTLKGLPPEEVTLPDGSRRKLGKIAVTQSLDPKTLQYSYFDDQRKTVKTQTSMLGTEMITWAVTREEALQELSGEDVDLAIATLIKTSKIENSLETRRVLYRVHVPGEDPAELLAQGPTQKIRRIDPHTVELEVLSLKPGATRGGEPEQEIERRFSQPNRFLQSDDRRVVELATKGVGQAQSPVDQSVALELWVRDKVKDKNFSTLMASAAEVAEKLSGDCTEHACLLAAMLRSRGVPSRIVVGLMYVPRDSAFGGHMWTEAFLNGVWVPLDGVLGKGRVGADHIKFLDAGLDDDEGDGFAAFVPVVSALGKMRIEVLEVEH